MSGWGNGSVWLGWLIPIILVVSWYIVTINVTKFKLKRTSLGWFGLILHIRTIVGMYWGKNLLIFLLVFGWQRGDRGESERRRVEGEKNCQKEIKGIKRLWILVSRKDRLGREMEYKALPKIHIFGPFEESIVFPIGLVMYSLTITN